MSAEYDALKHGTVASPAEDEAALRLEVNRVQASGALGEARLRRMVDYLAEKSLAGQSPKEIAIAMDVFGKNSDFDVSQDALVRVYIHNLRKALEDFYASSDQSGTKLHIPRGEYRLKVSVSASTVAPREAPPTARRACPRSAAALLGAAFLMAAGVVS